MKTHFLGTRHENYENLTSAGAYVLNSDLIRNERQFSADMNWHENPEIQWIKEGEGSVILNETELRVQAGDIIVVNPDVLHYTGFTQHMKYSCVIIGAKLLNDFELSGARYREKIHDDALLHLLNELDAANRRNDRLKAVRTQKILLEILLYLCERYAEEKIAPQKETVSFRRTKNTIAYIREHYQEKITLDILAKQSYVNKFLLAKEFKKITGRTIFGYINDYRSKRAAELIRNGDTVNEAALNSGFNNVSYFIRTYKKIYGEPPSKLKKERNA